MKRLIAFFILVAAFHGLAAAEDNSTNEVFEPWGSIHSLPEASSLFGMSGYHGPIFISQPSQRAVRGDIYFSPDHQRILVVPEPGPIFSSTNSGMNWTVFNKVGTYQFPVSSGADGAAMFVQVRLRAEVVVRSPLQSATNSPPNWYAVGMGQKGNRVILSADAAHPAPILTLQHSGSEVVVSWPASFTGYVLQQAMNLNPADWAAATNVVKVVGADNQVRLPTSMENHFFRLRLQ